MLFVYCSHRPLPQELIDYAREDTHYLLYIYDKMRYDLIERGNDQKNLLKSALDNSKLTCLRVSADLSSYTIWHTTVSASKIKAQLYVQAAHQAR